jgi:hypothetical protein
MGLQSEYGCYGEDKMSCPYLDLIAYIIFKVVVGSSTVWHRKGET